MERSSHAVLVASAFGAVAMTLGLAPPAQAMPDGVGSAQDVVDALRARGYAVVLTDAATPSLTHCTVAAVRPGPSTEKSSTTTVYVDVKC